MASSDYVPPEPRRQQRIDALCAQFAEGAASAERVAELALRVEPELRRPLLRQLLWLAWDRIAATGHPPNPTDFLSALPDERQTVAAVWDEYTYRGSASGTVSYHDGDGGGGAGSGTRRMAPGGADTSTESTALESDRPADAAIDDPGWVPGFTLLRKLGHGLAGVVYEAQQHEPKRRVALKLLWATAGPPQIARFRTEADVLADLQSDHIVALHEIRQAAGFHFLVMEYATLGSLDDYAQERGPLPQREAARMARDIARGVALAHSRGVVHRDLKPHNVLLTDDPADASRPRVKVADFGLARLRTGDDGDVPIGYIAGSLPYMAPEQADTRGPRASALSDVYGIGGILYRLLTGHAPRDFPPEDDAPSRLAVIRDTAPIPVRDRRPDIDRHLAAVCLRCLEVEPAARYASAAELADDLDRWLKHQPVTAHPVGAIERSRLWARRRPLTAGIAAVALLDTVLGVGFTLKYAQDARVEATAREAARQDAVEQRDLAIELAHENRVAAARSAAGRGDWARAIDHYDAAIADGYADALELRVERARGFFPLNDVDRLRQILADLPDDPDVLGEQAALVYLLRGDAALCDVETHAEGKRLLAAALAVPDGLVPADRHYARALLADEYTTAARELRTALEADPFHHRANAALLVLLIFGGEVEQARRQAHFVRTIFPADPLPDLAEALLELAAGNAAAGREHLAKLEQHFDPATQADLVLFYDFLAKLLDGLGTLQGDSSDGLPNLAKAFGTMLQLPPQVGQRLSRGSVTQVSLPVVGWAKSLATTLFRAYTLHGFGQTQRASDLLGEACEHHPEGFLRYFRGVLHLALFAQNYRDPERRLEELATAGQLLAEAVDGPTLVGGMRGLYLYSACVADAAIEVDRHEQGLPRDEVSYARLVDHLAQLQVQGRRQPKLRTEHWPRLLPLLAPELALPLAIDWQREASGDRAASLELAKVYVRANHTAAAKRLLDQWLEEHPDDAEFATLRDELTTDRP